MLSKKNIKSSFTLSFVFALIFSFALSVVNVEAANDHIKTLTVTVNTKNKMNLPQLGKEDFFVTEKGNQKEIVSVTPATSQIAPINLSIVIQEGVSQVNNELDAIKDFIGTLPEGSQVSITYLNGNFVNKLQPFTKDLNQAKKKLRVVNPSFNATSSPYIPLLDVMKQFNGMTQGRNQILFISNGIDTLGGFSSPSLNIYLERAIKIAQQENISIYSIFSSNSLRRGIFSGQNNLNYLSEQTGGYAFIQGTGFVSFDAPLKDFRQMLNNQYVITYKSNTQDKGFRQVKVTTDFSNVKVTTLKGYVAKS
jgi:VWFA-related protein